MNRKLITALASMSLLSVISVARASVRPAPIALTAQLDAAAMPATIANAGGRSRTTMLEAPSVWGDKGFKVFGPLPQTGLTYISGVPQLSAASSGPPQMTMLDAPSAAWADILFDN